MPLRIRCPPAMAPAQGLNEQAFVARHPALSYFALTFTVSWLGAFAVAAPRLLRGEALPKLTGILMFPAMLLGPSLVGVALTSIVDGKAGLRDLGSRLVKWRLPAVWYAVLALPPTLVLSVLFCLKTFVSPVYAPNRFFVGLAFGVPAGILEEIGWMGYAFPKLSLRLSSLPASFVLGFLWSAWHLPVIDFLGTAAPHGIYWFPFFLAFAAAMTAMRVLICWVYSNTRSVLLAQLLHISSTASLVVFGAPQVTAHQEVLWYSAYAVTLWAAVAAVAMAFGPRLTRQRVRPQRSSA